jgi:hypothetical protein
MQGQKRKPNSKAANNGWLDYPEHQPKPGSLIVVNYEAKSSGTPKKELVEWTFKTMTSSANTPELKFKFHQVPD